MKIKTTTVPVRSALFPKKKKKKKKNAGLDFGINWYIERVERYKNLSDYEHNES
jgi:hypothetical protein